MDQQQRNLEFRKMADSFIEIANQHSDKHENSRVGSALLYAASRFSSFVVASHAANRESFEAEIDNAVEFFTAEFKRMLSENLEEYKSEFSPAQSEVPKYQHLMKNDKKGE